MIDVVEEFLLLDTSNLKLRDKITFVDEAFEDKNGNILKSTRIIIPDDKSTTQSHRVSQSVKASWYS